MANGTLRIIFNPINLLNLLTHYTDGDMPLDAKLLEWGKHPMFDRKILLLVESDQWKDMPPAGREWLDNLVIRYECKRTLSWGDKRSELAWKPTDNFEDH